MRKGRKILAVSLLVLGCFLFPATVYATEPETQTQTQTEAVTEPQTETEGKQGGGYNSKQTFGIDTELDGLSGNAKYLGSQYRDNYKLDLEKTGITEILDAGLNAVANMLFSAIRMIGMGLITFIYFCLDFNFADAFSRFLTGIQSSLFSGVYEQLWLLAVMILAGFILMKLVKRDLAGILTDFFMVIFVSVLSMAMIHNSATILTASTDLTKNISSGIFQGLDNATQGEQNNKSYAQNAAGALWVDLVHMPWLTMEFGDAQVDEEMVEKILSLEPGSSDRKDIVEDLNEETGCFDKSRGIDRLGMLLCYLVPFLLKLVVLAAISAMQMLGQFLAVFVILLATFVLILALVPSYGIDVIRKWLDKFVDVHLSMMILSFLLALMLWLNKVLFTYAGTFGWFITLLIQSVLCLILALNFKTILHLLLHPRDGMQDVQRMLRMMARQNRQGQGGGDYYSPPYEDRGNPSQGQGETYGGGQESSYGQGTGYGPGYYGQGESYDQEAYYGHTSGYRDIPPYDMGDQGYSDGDGTQPQASYYRPPQPPPYMDARYAQDYGAVRRAPTQQEIYDLYQDAPDAEIIVEENQDPAAVLAIQAKPIPLLVDKEREMAVASDSGSTAGAGYANEETAPADEGPEQSTEMEEERRAPVKFRENGIAGQDAAAQSQENIRVSGEEAQKAPVQESLPQAGYAGPQTEEVRELEESVEERPETESIQTEEAMDMKDTD